MMSTSAAATAVEEESSLKSSMQQLQSQPAATSSTITTHENEQKNNHVQTKEQQQENNELLPSDKYWKDEITKELQSSTIWNRNRSLCLQVLNDILPKWQRELSANDTLNSPWGKIKKRIVKELNESEPFIMYILNLLKKQQQQSPNTTTTTKFCIIDLCSGFGILSMLLSELIPLQSKSSTSSSSEQQQHHHHHHQVESIWLLDKSFPLDYNNIQSHHISIKHFINRKWPIPLKIRKIDLKRSREIKQLYKYVFPTPTPTDTKIIFVGVHLCKSLSIHAINLYNSCLDIGAIALLLKPCCLPGKKHLYNRTKENGKIPLTFTFPHNGYSFPVIDLYNNTNINYNNNYKDKNNNKLNDSHQDTITNHKEEEEEEEEREEVECGCVGNGDGDDGADNKYLTNVTELQPDEAIKTQGVNTTNNNVPSSSEEKEERVVTKPVEVKENQHEKEQEHDEHEDDSTSEPTTAGTTTTSHHRPRGGSEHQDHYCIEKGISHKRFTRWMNHLYLGCQSDKCHVRIENVTVQRTHFQNQFLFCETISN